MQQSLERRLVVSLWTVLGGAAAAGAAIGLLSDTKFLPAGFAPYASIGAAAVWVAALVWLHFRPVNVAPPGSSTPQYLTKRFVTLWLGGIVAVLWIAELVPKDEPKRPHDGDVDLLRGGLAAYDAGDYPKAIALLEKSAQLGNVEANWHVGEMYSHGEGGRGRDQEKAFTLLKAAADRGFAPAQASLGLAFAGGQGTAKDTRVAEQWMRQAAAQQNPVALTYLAQLAKDEDERVALLYAAANRHDPIAQQVLADVLLKRANTGSLTKGWDLETSWKLMHFSALQGNPTAWLMLHNYYLAGNDYERAYAILELAMERLGYFKEAAERLEELRKKVDPDQLLKRREGLARVFTKRRMCLIRHTHCTGEEHPDMAAARSLWGRTKLSIDNLFFKISHAFSKDE